MADTFTFNPTQIHMDVCGIVIQGGVAKGTFLSYEPEADGFVDDVGSDGTVVRVATNDKRGTFTFTVLQQSPVNAQLSALYALDTNTLNGAGVGALLVQDKITGSQYFSESAWIQKFPSVEYGNEVKTVQWVVRGASVGTLLLG